MRKPSHYPFAVSGRVWLLLALVVHSILAVHPLCAQGLLKRKPLPNDIQDAEQAERFLSGLDVEDLLGYERVEPVCIQFLKRGGIPEFARLQAIKKLAELQQSDPVDVLLPWIERFDESQPISPSEHSTLNDLASLLPQQPPAALKRARDRVEKLATEGNQDATRRSAMAALAAADGSCDAIWLLASESSRSLVDVLRSVPQLPSDLPRDSLFANVEPLLRERDKPEIQSAAIEAAALLDASGRETFETLSNFIQQGTHPGACVRGICNIPSNQWTGSHRKPLADSLIARLAATPIKERTSRETRDSIKLIKTLASLMSSQDEADVRSELDKHTLDVHQVSIVKDARFNPDVIVVQKGKGLEIVFRNEGTERHRPVIVDLRAVESIGQLEALDEADVVVTRATEPVEPGESSSVFFLAPDEVATYGLSISHAGKWKISGALLIVSDVPTYRRKHPALPSAEEVLGVLTTEEAREQE